MWPCWCLCVMMIFWMPALPLPSQREVIGHGSTMGGPAPASPEAPAAGPSGPRSARGHAMRRRSVSARLPTRPVAYEKRKPYFSVFLQPLTVSCGASPNCCFCFIDSARLDLTVPGGCTPPFRTWTGITCRNDVVPLVACVDASRFSLFSTLWAVCFDFDDEL